MYRSLFAIPLFLLISLAGWCQSAEIYHDLQKLGVLGTALYVAAHPDDENTRMISHLSNDRKVRTVYLSLTRGDGGQNLLGPELGPQLGVIRTQELLAARRIDGGEQFFSRANDFGYSKTPEETMDIWENEEVLADVVWAIRKFKPDVIINRFNHERTRRTHGHHTASAMLSYEAFDLAGDPEQFTDQLDHVQTWEPSRLFFNTSWWFYGSREKFAEANKENMAEVDVGTYYPVLGASNNEIAARSRSMHKCQGFGARLRRGSQIEYLELLLGKSPDEKNDIFDGIDISWNRVKGGKDIDNLLTSIISDFDFTAPQESIPDLLDLRNLISQIDDKHWKDIKLRDLDAIIKKCLGLHLEAFTYDEELIIGEPVEWTLEVINRSPVTVDIIDVRPHGISMDTQIQRILKENEAFDLELVSTVEADQPTSPFWINEKATLGMYHVPDPTMIGEPESAPDAGVDLLLKINGTTLAHFVPIKHKHIDPVDGEVIDNAPVSSGLSASFSDEITLFRTGEEKSINVHVKAFKDISTTIELSGGSGWTITPAQRELDLGRGEEATISFTVTAPLQAIRTEFELLTGDGESINQETRISYDHIPIQQIVKTARATFIGSDIELADVNIGYIEGAGDKVAESLRQLGYDVDIIDPGTISPDRLASYDVVIIGIRAFNTVDELKYKNNILFDFAENGGTLVLQYNTRHRLVTQDISPIPLKLSRLRVTDEHSPVHFNLPDHDVLNYPNAIGQEEFEGWVQERGLYFPDEWDETFAAPLAMHDPGEEPLDGSLLIAPYGKGHYVYSSLSWFRQFPAGVEGAYKLFANILALDKKPRP
ncbi:MAG: PIG-L family deacetylase [Saprospiraceae bacterium]|nr:PIG-L family deacetylase [Saprospiraceae bacterium]